MIYYKFNWSYLAGLSIIFFSLCFLSYTHAVNGYKKSLEKPRAEGWEYYYVIDCYPTFDKHGSVVNEIVVFRSVEDTTKIVKVKSTTQKYYYFKKNMNKKLLLNLYFFDRA